MAVEVSAIGRPALSRLLAVAAALLITGNCARSSTLPHGLTDAEFRGLMDGLSEPAGSFDISDNLVSNEPRVAENARWITSSGGAYIGVGPEQNFTYIAQARPEIAFVIDIRRENRNLHLLYKALFELSRDRADFASMLFSRLRPTDLSSRASADALFDAFGRVAPSSALLVQTVSLVRAKLMEGHGLPLTSADLDDIQRALTAFYEAGPAIDFWGTRKADPKSLRPSDRKLMTMVDNTGQARSFLSSEGAFAFVKDLHVRNLIVPLVGDFGGAGVIRRVGAYVAQHGAVVTTFYGSNVPVYLTVQQHRAYCGHLASLPAARGASYVDNDSVRPLRAKLEDCARMR
jgi:hypothetical protein